MGNRLQGHYYGYTEAMKNLLENTPLAKKYDSLVPTKYLFLLYSQTQSSEIPFCYAVFSGSNNYIL